MCTTLHCEISLLILWVTLTFWSQSGRPKIDSLTQSSRHQKTPSLSVLPVETQWASIVDHGAVVVLYYLIINSLLTIHVSAFMYSYVRCGRLYVPGQNKNP